MANSTNPYVAFNLEFWPEIMLRHAFFGVFFWEFFTTLEYEWNVIWGRIPYRWTILIYSVSRVACLMALILNAVMINVPNHIHCQLWLVLYLFLANLALAAASLLIVLRILAIWNRNKVAVAMAISVWVINVGFLIQGVARLREDGSASVLGMVYCAGQATFGNRLTLISLAATDIVLLLMMLVGLFRLRHDGYGCATFGLARLLWKQGVIWISLATIIEIPPAVCAIFNLNVGPAAVAYLLSLDAQQLRIPAIVTMVIAATRMHRSLVDFATPDVTHKNFQKSGLKFAKNKQIRATTIPLNPMESPVLPVSQQHTTGQMSYRGLSTNIDEAAYEEPKGPTLDEGVERVE